MIKKPPLPNYLKKEASNPKLTEAQFYIHKTYALMIELDTVKYQLELAMRVSNAQKMECERLRHELGLSKVSALGDNIEKTKKAFSEYKKELESELGITFNNKVIDNITFEIKDI